MPFVCSYESSTGFFTVPLGGEGLYYFSVYFTVNENEFALFDIKINERSICSAYADQSDSVDSGLASCSAVTFAAEGKIINTKAQNK